MSEETGQNITPKRAPRRRHKFVRRTVKVLAGLLLLIVAAIGCLYIPGVLNQLLKWAAPKIEEASGLRVSADNISLKFPLDIDIDNLLVINVKQTGDTMIAARNASLGLSLPALTKGQLKINDALLTDALYRMGGRDSMYLSARLDSAGLTGHMDLADNRIVLDRTDINGGLVHLVIGTDTTSTPPDTTAVPLELLLGRLTMRNVVYSMYMASSNDTIAATIREASLSSGRIFAADTVDITAGTVVMNLDSALYGTVGATPVPGLDFSHMTLRDGSLQLDSFKMHGTALTLPITSLTAHDFAGMTLQGHGTYAMDSTALYARRFDLTLNGRSRLLVDAEMGLDSLVPAPIRLDATAELFTPALTAAFPAALPLVAPLPDDVPLRVRAVVGGTMADLHIDTLAASMPDIFSLKGSGRAENLTDTENMILDVDLEGSLKNSRPFASLLPAGVKLPPLRLKATAKALGSDYGAKLTAVTAGGRLALDGRMTGKAPDYRIDLRADSFPVAAFMPNMGIGAVSGHIKASGRGFNPLAPGAALTATARINSVEYRHKRLGGINLDASLNRGDLMARINSSAAPADLALDLDGHLGRKSLDWKMQGNIRRLDLHALGMSDSVMNARMALASEGFATLSLDSISAFIHARNLDLNYGSQAMRLDSLGATANIGRHTLLSLGNRTLTLDFNGDLPLQPTLDRLTKASALAADMIARRDLRPDTLAWTLPPFSLSLDARPGNPIAEYLKSSDMSFNTLKLTARNDSALNADARIINFRSGEDMRIDTITARLRTLDNRLLIDANMNNRPGTFDEFASVGLRGEFSGNRGKFFLQQKNIEGATGYELGFRASVTDTVIGLRITPADPIIAYKNWTVNEDNYVALDPRNFHIMANLDAHGDGSRLQLLTTEHTDTDSLDSPNDLKLRVSDIHLQDWLKINPFAPPIAGDVSANMNVAYTTRTVNGSGTVTLANLTYGKKKVGDFDMDIDLATAFGGAVHANLGLNVNGKRALTALGAINDTLQQSPVNMYLQVKEFPLDIANPFLPASTAQLDGTLNGRMAVNGTFAALKLNGNLNFRRARVNVGMMGSAFTLDSVNIPVDSNFVKFNNFAIFGSNANPLRVNGTVDLRKFAAPGLNLALKAQNMQIINSKKAKGVDLFGRGFIDLDATVKGTMSFLNVNANLAILPLTNLTYQMSDAMVAAGLQPEEDVVKFVNFADTTRTAQADSIAPSGMMMLLSALLDIRQGSQFTVNLSADGTNRAQIKGQGILDYTMSPTQPDGRLTGRFTIDGGSFRYSLPIISEKLFHFNPGSYVAFNGPVLDPQLNISAYDEVRANITRSGENSRLINFNVGLNVTGTLERLNVAFDLSTKDDITVQNELQSMSPTQRANQAMNLLLYGSYSGQGTTGNANLSGNALYGFLTSQLNTWAANTIKGVDLSFGLDQYDRTRNGSTSTATQYSYKVSKSLFNDRFKIVVGGNYSTDADAEENFAQNLISDVSFEYMLNQSGSMYVRLFRHTGYESILEGEVTQTGVGFVVKRKINRLADIFNFIKAAKQ